MAIAAAWILCLAAQAGGSAESLHHDALIDGGLPLVASLLLFLLAWQAMTAAMMLPSSLPMVRVFGRVSANQDRPGAVMAAFIGGYALVWTMFGALAFMGDLALHRGIDASPWLDQHPWAVSGALLAFVGAFQFSSLKDRCLDKCRLPTMFIMQRYDRGAAAAYRLGRSHGIYCLGCCWALMLLMFAAGVASLAWMGVLAAVMVYEKIGRHGRRLVPIVGVVLLVWAGLIFLQPRWLPDALAGTQPEQAHAHADSP